MLCEHYKDLLVEAAATGAEPLGELRAHLAACASCRSTLAGEQSLFASIDTGLHATANAEVPPSLLPRVRAALAQVPITKRAWLSNGFVLATAAAAVLALSLSLAIRHRGPGRHVESTVTATNPPTFSPPAPQVQAPRLALHSNSNSTQRPHATSPGNRATNPLQVGPSVVVDVLVPRDQEVLLVRYSEQWRSRKTKTVLAEVSNETSLEPLQLAPIQIGQLDVKLLAEGQSQ